MLHKHEGRVGVCCWLCWGVLGGAVLHLTLLDVIFPFDENTSEFMSAM